MKAEERMNVSRLFLIVGKKMVPYLFVNAIQVLIMIAIGRYIVPLLGHRAAPR